MNTHRHHMKKILFAAAIALLAVSCSDKAAGDGSSRKGEVKDLVMNDPTLWGGTFSMYPEDQPLPARPPKGYKPFYISHMGRHGARFIDGRGFYSDMLETWETADSEGRLTPAGREFLEAYRTVYPKLQYHEGILTEKGQNQHRLIADQMYRDYPEVFRGKTKAAALSSDSHRVIVSMMCLLDELSELDRDLDFSVDYGRPYFSVIIPESTGNPNYMPMQPFTEEALEVNDRFIAQVFDQDAFLAKWFTSTEGLDTDTFMYHFVTMVADFCNLDFEVPATLSEAFTPEERYALWRVQNYSDYMYTGVAPGVDKRRMIEMSVTAKDIIDRFDEDCANGVALRLRFSHDTALAPLVSYLGVNGMDAEISDPFEVENVWKSYEIPMACNFQLVFFRSRRNPDDILIQALLNGFQATLPLPEAAPGFYRWSDFKARFGKVLI